MADDERRYQEILRKIASRGPFGSPAPAQEPDNPLDRALNGINAFDSLARLTQRDYADIVCYGPKALRGSTWSAVVLWYQPKGYHGYQTLSLLGVWAQQQGSEMALSIGIRQLPYRAPVFDAGVYRVAIQNGFRLYYEDDGHPPGADDQLLYRAIYRQEQRLNQRQALREICCAWQDQRPPG